MILELRRLDKYSDACVLRGDLETLIQYVESIIQDNEYEVIDRTDLVNGYKKPVKRWLTKSKYGTYKGFYIELK